jgi:hypothetical protein
MFAATHQKRRAFLHDLGPHLFSWLRWQGTFGTVQSVITNINAFFLFVFKFKLPHIISSDCIIQAATIN